MPIEVSPSDGIGRQQPSRFSVTTLTIPRNIALAIFLFSVGVFLLYRPLSEPEGGDAAIYDYISQSILRGQLPYRDVIDIKAPGEAYMSALAMWAGRSVGVRDIIASRSLHILLGAILCVSTFLVADIYLESRIAATIAPLILLMSGYFTGWTIAGGQPKLAMILFGILTLLLIARDRPFWAGVCSMLSCLFWQPGLLFTGAAFLIFSRYLTSWRDLKAARVIIGAATPLVGMLVYFYSAAILSYFWSYGVEYNYGTFGPEASKPLTDALSHIWRVMLRVYRADIVLVVMALIGLTAFVFERIRRKLAGLKSLSSPDSYRDALMFPPIVYFGFCLLNFQSGPDLIPFFPFIGIFAGLFFLRAARIIVSKKWFAKWPLVSRPEPVLCVVLVAMTSVTLIRAVSYRPNPSETLQAQDQQLEPISALLGTNDKVYVHGRVEMLVLMNRPNMNPFVDLDWGMDDYIVSKLYGGSFNRFLDEMESEAPKLVSIARIGHFSHRDELLLWLVEHYEKLPVKGFEVYIRKQP